MNDYRWLSGSHTVKLLQHFIPPLGIKLFLQMPLSTLEKPNSKTKKKI